MSRRVLTYLGRHHVALLALFFALGGTTFAAATKLLPANSVGTRQVINHSLLGKDFKKGQLPRGGRGPTGAAGRVGPTGPPGPSGTNLFHDAQSSEVLTSSTMAVDLGGPSVTVSVPAGAMVMVYASATMKVDATGTDAVARLFEPTDYPTPDDLLGFSQTTFTTIYSGPVSFWGSSSMGGWRIVPKVTPGIRTYSLRYASTTGSSNARFKDRELWVAVVS